MTSGSGAQACLNYTTSKDNPGTCTGCGHAWASHDESFTATEIVELEALPAYGTPEPPPWNAGDHFCIDHPALGITVYGVVCEPETDERTDSPDVVIVRSWSKATSPRGERGTQRISEAMNRISKEEFDLVSNHGWVI